MKTKCQECGGLDLQWHCTVINNSEVQQGRLRSHDMGVLFYLGCNDCSATVSRASGDQIAQHLCRAEQTATAVVAGPANNMAEMAMLNKLVELGAKAYGALAESNGDDGTAGTAAYGRWQELRAEMGELIRCHAARAVQAPAAPATPVQILALRRARSVLQAIGKTYDDSELRTRALEVDEEIDRLLAMGTTA